MLPLHSPLRGTLSQEADAELAGSRKSVTKTAAIRWRMAPVYEAKPVTSRFSRTALPRSERIGDHMAAHASTSKEALRTNFSPFSVKVAPDTMLLSTTVIALGEGLSEHPGPNGPRALAASMVITTPGGAAIFEPLCPAPVWLSVEVPPL